MGFDGDGGIYLSFPYEHRVVARLDPGAPLPRLCGAPGQRRLRGGLGTRGGRPEGNIFVADTYSRTFKKFDRDGWLLAAWPLSGPGYEQLRSIGGMAVDDYGNVYATDYTNGMILKFSPGS